VKQECRRRVIWRKSTREKRSNFFVWDLFHRARKQNLVSMTKSMWNNVMDDGEVHYINR
jgi:hypothetical protein